MKSPISGSFNEVTNAFAAIVANNPALAAKQGWPTARSSQEEWMDAREAQRMLAHGWVDFVQLEYNEVAPPPAQKKTLWRSAVGSASRLASGGALLADWLGSNRTPVAREVADRRAVVCAGCAKNDGGDFTAYFSVPVADQIRTLLSIKHDLDLHTSHDDKLTVCSACDCPLSLKIWSPIDMIAQRMSSETRSRLDSRCWVLAESVVP